MNTNPVAFQEDSLPPGWTKRESKSQKGRYYYVSPTGKTQWVRPQPQIASRQKYTWIKECEIEFAEGRLGVSLHEVKQTKNIPYAQFQSEVDDLPKISGKPGAAELYNWSVKPEKRLAIGMRLTDIDGDCLAGYTYAHVVDKLKKSSRPVKLKFADVTQGTVEDNPEDLQVAKQETKMKETQAKHSSAYLEQKEELVRVLIMSELRGEMWRIETKKLMRTLTIQKYKSDLIQNEYAQFKEKQLQQKLEKEELVVEENKYKKMLELLKLEAVEQIESAEYLRHKKLTKQNSVLEEDIGKLVQATKKLRKERSALQSNLDDLDKQLTKMAPIDADGSSKRDDKEDDVFALDTSASAEEQLLILRAKAKQMEDELGKEQRKLHKVEKEMSQLNRHLNRMDSSASGSSKGTHKHKDDSKGSGSEVQASTEREVEIKNLEARIAELRQAQRSVVGALAKAADSGNHEEAKEHQEKRTAIKDELRKAQDLLHDLKSKSSRDLSSSFQSASKTKKPSKKVISRTEIEEPKLNTENKDANPVVKTMPTLSGSLHKGPTEWSEKGLIGNMKTMRGARERWCEITPEGYLQYYKRRGDPVVRGQIFIGDPSFEIICEDTKRGTEFSLCTSTQQSQFFTKTTEELLQWVNAIKDAKAYLMQETKPKSARSAVIAYQATHSSKRSHHKPTESSSCEQGETGISAPTDALLDKENDFYGRATLGF